MNFLSHSYPLLFSKINPWVFNTIYKLIRDNDAPTVKKLVTIKPSLLDVCNDNGWQPYHIAALLGKKECLEALFTSDMDLNKVNTKNDWSMLHLAAYHGHLEIVQYLITKGADISIKDKQGRTPEQLAKLMGRVSIVDFISNYSKKQYNLDLSRSISQSRKL